MTLRMSRSTRRHVRFWWHRSLLVLWMCVGMVSYGVVWLSLTQDIDRSYSVVSLRHAQGRQQQQQQQQEWEQQRLERLEQEQRAQTLLRTRRSKRKSGTHSTPTTITSTTAAAAAAATRESSLDPPPAQEEVEDDNEPDWVFWVLSAAFLVLSYCRIRLEPDYRRRRALQHPLPPPPPLPQEQALMHTLRRVNHEREARGEEPISMDAYQALRQALLQDRALWRGLMAQQQQNQRGGNAIVGATPEQLEACPQRIMAVGDVTEGDCCSICLMSYHLKDRLRELPCRHCFHTDCIDQWLEQSTLCPICKASLG